MTQDHSLQHFVSNKKELSPRTVMKDPRKDEDKEGLQEEGLGQGGAAGGPQRYRIALIRQVHNYVISKHAEESGKFAV